MKEKEEEVNSKLSNRKYHTQWEFCSENFEIYPGLVSGSRRLDTL
jgi:hypothetical protein